MGKYVHDLYNDERDGQHGIESAAEGPDILPDKVEYAINELKNGKTLGPDEIRGGVFKLLDAVGIRKLTKLLNAVYTTAGRHYNQR